MNARNAIVKKQRWVFKLGSSLLTNHGQGLDQQAIGEWVAQLAELYQQGRRFIIVSSGAVAEGIKRLGWRSRPSALHELQAAAAVGQMGLVQAWESKFQHYGIHTAQILLTHEDLTDRRRYLNARTTMRTLLDLGVVPVVNENDTVTTEEIRFGDNDSLAALVANLVEAEVLLLMTDQAGLFDADPRTNTDAQLISEAKAHDHSLDAMVMGAAGSLGRGGMRTKIRAARLAARSGASTLIADGREPGVILRLTKGEALGTLLLPDSGPLAARKQWLAGHLQPHGQLVLDKGAVQVVREQGRSLLSVGVSAVKGSFTRGEVVSCFDEVGNEVARGLVNYSADETGRIMRRSSKEIEAILGYVDEPELIHRDNLVLV